jgi:aspartyl-tRNA(Asn)/glutamyl-tRNA(Gln) amidotransferase subunit A
MVEFAYGGWGTNPVKGAPKNPWDLKEHRVAGGSSSGSAVAVAADLAPAALGTDTGGSVRIPAAWCGLVGLKTSKGLISQKGLVPLSPTLDTVGPMTRTIRDAALLLDCMSGDDLADQSAALVINLGLTEQIELGVSGLRLGVLAGADIDGLDPEIETLFQEAAEQFRDMGATVEPIELPRSVDEYFGAAAEIMSVESYHNLARYVVEPGASVDPVIKARILRGSEISAPHYLAVLEFRKAAQQEVASRMDRLDALLVPGSHMLPVPLSQVDENSSPNRYGRFVNFLDMASLAVPLGLSSSRLPIGLQIVVRRFDDTLALRIGRAFEIARGGLFRAPAGF